MTKTASLLTETHFYFCPTRLWDDLKTANSIRLQYQIFLLKAHSFLAKFFNFNVLNKPFVFARLLIFFRQ
jgi:hypothetical protein